MTVRAGKCGADTENESTGYLDVDYAWMAIESNEDQKTLYLSRREIDKKTAAKVDQDGTRHRSGWLGRATEENRP